jgi:hypothetical protein
MLSENPSFESLRPTTTSFGPGPQKAAHKERQPEDACRFANSPRLGCQLQIIEPELAGTAVEADADDHLARLRGHRD